MSRPTHSAYITNNHTHSCTHTQNFSSSFSQALDLHSYIALFITQLSHIFNNNINSDGRRTPLTMTELTLTRPMVLPLFTRAARHDCSLAIPYKMFDTAADYPVQHRLQGIRYRPNVPKNDNSAVTAETAIQPNGNLAVTTQRHFSHYSPTAIQSLQPNGNSAVTAQRQFSRCSPIGSTHLQSLHSLPKQIIHICHYDPQTLSVT